MASNSVVTVQTPKTTPQSWDNSDAANTQKTIATAGTGGAKVVGIIATSSDTTARVFDVMLNRSSTSYRLGATSITAASGTDGNAPTTNLLLNMQGLPIDNDGQSYFFLESGDVLKANNQTQVTSGKAVHITVIFGNF